MSLPALQAQAGLGAVHPDHRKAGTGLAWLCEPWAGAWGQSWPRWVFDGQTSSVRWMDRWMDE